MKNYKLVIGRKNVEKLDMSKLNVVPARFYPYLIDLNPAVASSKDLENLNGRDKEINRNKLSCFCIFCNLIRL